MRSVVVTTHKVRASKNPPTIEENMADAKSLQGLSEVCGYYMQLVRGLCMSSSAVCKESEADNCTAHPVVTHGGRRSTQSCASLRLSLLSDWVALPRTADPAFDDRDVGVGLLTALRQIFDVFCTSRAVD